MLDPQDLNQIREIVKDETRSVIKAEVPSIVSNQIKAEVPSIISNQIKAEVPSIISNQIKAEVPSIVSNQIKAETPSIVQNIVKTEINKALKPVKRDLKKIKQDQNTIIEFFDQEHTKLRSRVDKLEEIAGIIP